MYVELPKFNKTEDELENMMDKWIYALKNISRLLDKPAALQERIFTRFFELADIKKFSPEDMLQYEASLKAYRDNNNIMQTAEDKGVEKGIAIGRKEGEKNKALEIARNLKASSVATEIIMQSTGLTAEDIEKL